MVTLQRVPMTFLKPKTEHPPIGILICYEMWCSFFNPPRLLTILWSRVLQFDYMFCEKVLPFPLMRPCRYPSDVKTNLQWSYFTFGQDFFFFIYIFFLIQLGCFLQRIQRISCLWHSFAFSCWTAESRGTNVNQSSERQLAIRSTTESPFLEYKPRNTHECLGVGLLSPLDSHKQTNM